MSDRPTKCCGECYEEGTCRGEVKRVWVQGHSYSGANFDYCETAIAEDKRRGFEVLPPKEVV